MKQGIKCAVLAAILLVGLPSFAKVVGSPVPGSTGVVVVPPGGPTW
jgi:hypothetical protein